MIILGLTGSIGMGKSTTAKMLRRLHVPVHEADWAVHDLMAKGGMAVAAIEAAFPGVTVAGAVDRKALGARVFGNKLKLRQLERILHPLVRRHTALWIRRQYKKGYRMVVLDIPLLFEGGRERGCDGVLVVSAPPSIQRRRVLKRAGMDEARFRSILSHQMPDAQKRKRADVVIPTGRGKAATYAALRAAISFYRQRRGYTWMPGWENLAP